MTKCLTGYVLVNKACYPCSVSAGYDSCSIESTYALSCKTGYVLVNGYCYACPSNANTCTGGLVSLTCASTYYLSNGVC